MTKIEGIAAAPATSGSSYRPDELWSPESIKSWIGRPVVYEGGQVGTITKAWVSEDGHTVYFEAEVDLP